MKLRYLGHKFPKRIPLPVPLRALSEQTGEVVCDPVGDFPKEDALRLLEIAPGAFEVVEEGETTVEFPTENPARRRRFKQMATALKHRNMYFPGCKIQEENGEFFE